MSTEERLRSKKYDPTVRPFFLSGKPCKVQLQIFLLHLGPVNQLEMRYTMDIFLRQRWTDPRLADPKLSTVTLNQDTIDLLWMPGLYALNEMDGTFHTITTPNRLIHVDTDGSITYSQRYRV
ncbi:Glycine receptor subunit alpha-3 [Lamellibrachia satsuma]|nr:Glycine receptor subunit alpha-3 [Lamellibrachia satsuma]